MHHGPGCPREHILKVEDQNQALALGCPEPSISCLQDGVRIRLKFLETCRPAASNAQRRSSRSSWSSSRPPSPTYGGLRGVSLSRNFEGHMTRFLKFRGSRDQNINTPGPKDNPVLNLQASSIQRPAAVLKKQLKLLLPPLAHTRWPSRASLPRNFEGHVTRFAI